MANAQYSSVIELLLTFPQIFTSYIHRFDKKIYSEKYFKKIVHNSQLKMCLDKSKKFKV